MARSRSRWYREYVREWVRIPWWFQFWYAADNEHGNRTNLYLWDPQSDDVFIVGFITIQRGTDRNRGQERAHTSDVWASATQRATQRRRQ